MAMVGCIRRYCTDDGKRLFQDRGPWEGCDPVIYGFNVYPNEIEDVLAQHPKILEVAAMEHTG